MSIKQDEIIDLINKTGVSESWVASKLGVSPQYLNNQLKRNKDILYELYIKAKEILNNVLAVNNVSVGTVGGNVLTGDNMNIVRSNLGNNCDEYIKEIEQLKKEISLLESRIKDKDMLIEILNKPK